MKAINALFFTVLFISVGSVSAQNQKNRVCGEYSVCNVTPPAPKPDTIDTYGPVRIVQPIVLSEFRGAYTLKLKWNKRFTITNAGPITTYGLNTDHPIIHGTYKMKNDTLILIYRYNIQHFNKLAPKSRVKGKYKQRNRPQPVKRYARMESGQFKISKYRFWCKRED